MPFHPLSLTTHLASSSSNSSSSRRTNSLAVTNLPKEFFHPRILEHLYRHFQTYGVVNQWIPLPGFARILIVYEEEQSADDAKTWSDPIKLDATQDRPELVLRVFRADPNPLRSGLNNEIQYLELPSTDRHFLLSPPGSPSASWESVREEPPNHIPLADDLASALKNLQLHQESKITKNLVILDGEESPITVILENFDSGSCDEDDWTHQTSRSPHMKWKPLPASMPPSSMIPVY